MSETSDAQILIDIDKWKKSAAYYLVDDEKQMGRVILVTVGCEWYTLREIEKLIAGKYPEHMDTPAAISARLREVSPYKHGLVKQKFLKMENKSKSGVTGSFRLCLSEK